MNRTTIGRLTAMVAVMALAGCGGQSGDTPHNVANSAAASAVSAPANASAPANLAQSAPATAAAPVSIAQKNDALDFAYSWPGEASAIPVLDGWLRGNADTLRKRTLKEAEGYRAEAKKDGYPFRQYSYEETFKALANTPAVLVLQSEGYIYTGGAHGMPITTDIIWDKAAGKRLATRDLIDLASFAKVAKDRYCKELDRQRLEKRGKDAGSMGIDEFTQCVPILEQDVLPFSRSGKALDAIRILIAPYNAGPYAEGSYVIDLPIDTATLATVKPAWKGAFSTGM